MSDTWYRIQNSETVPSPALLIHPDRIESNIRRMLEIAGSPDRLRPHVKTHKMPNVIRMQLDAGIAKFKCATIAEMEMVAEAGAPDILLAYQPVGPNIQRLKQLTENFPEARFSAVVDDPETVRKISAVFAGDEKGIELLIDLDCGMHRTGIAPGPEAAALYRLISELPGIEPGGLHAYDGHIHEPGLEDRTRERQTAMAPVFALRDELLAAGLPVPRLVSSGSPTFGLHAQDKEIECSPGTTLLWDFGYSDAFPELRFLHAALVFTRVISKPGTGLLCLDLGHKAIAAENPHPRVRFPDLPDAEALMQSEEHLVLKTGRAADFKVGDCLYGIPRHICPTVALHDKAVVVRNGKACDRWNISARTRILTV